MARDSLKVVATLVAQADKADQLKPILLRLIGPTRAEAGCLSYELFQNQSDASEFVFVEEWVSAAVLDEHLTTAHVQEALSQAQPLLAHSPEIRRYTKIG